MAHNMGDARAVVEPEFLRIDEVAALTGIHKQSIRRLIREAGFPVCRVLIPGGKKPILRFERRAVVDWMRSHAVGAEA